MTCHPAKFEQPTYRTLPLLTRRSRAERFLPAAFDRPFMSWYRSTCSVRSRRKLASQLGPSGARRTGVVGPLPVGKRALVAIPPVATSLQYLAEHCF